MRMTRVLSHLTEYGMRRKLHFTKQKLFLWQACVSAKSLQSCSTLCDPMNCSPPGSSVYGVLQARILERVVMPSST